MKYETGGFLTDKQQDYNSAYEDGWRQAKEQCKYAVLKGFGRNTLGCDGLLSISIEKYNVIVDAINEKPAGIGTKDLNNE